MVDIVVAFGLALAVERAGKAVLADRK